MAEHNNSSLIELANSILELSKTYQPSQAGLVSEPEIVKKAKALISCVQTPMDHGMDILSPIVLGSTIRTLVSFKVLDAIPSPGSVSLAELESATGVQTALLERLLRVVIGSGFIVENESKTYSHTSLSVGYTSNSMLGSVYPALFDEVAVQTRLADYFRERGAREPDDEKASTHNPMTWHAGQEGKTVFEIMAQRPDKVVEFQNLMRMAQAFRPWTGAYDFSVLASDANEDRALLVDVGGADGTMVGKILEAHPELKPTQCVVQDLESAISLGRKNERLPSGVQLQVHDFFTLQPVQGAKAYHFRAICHDWSDTMVVKILSQIVPAMAPDSKVLIADNVLPEGGVTGLTALMDISMLCIGGKERTRRNWEAVVGEAGLKIDGVHLPPQGNFATIEASLK